jgi:hypothetical protein
MTDARAILCDFTDFKRVATRNTFQLIFELPLEQAEEAIKLLGNPLPGKTLKCGIARISLGDASTRKDEGTTSTASDRPRVQDSSPAKTKWQKLRPSAQAAIRCDDKEFGDFIADQYPHHLAGHGCMATAVRKIVGVHSRAVLDSDDTAAVAWADLEAEYQDWRGTHKAIQQAEAYAR